MLVRCTCKANADLSLVGGSPAGQEDPPERQGPLRALLDRHCFCLLNTAAGTGKALHLSLLAALHLSPSCLVLRCACCAGCGMCAVPVSGLHKDGLSVEQMVQIQGLIKRRIPTGGWAHHGNAVCDCVVDVTVLCVLRCHHAVGTSLVWSGLRQSLRLVPACYHSCFPGFLLSCLQQTEACSTAASTPHDTSSLAQHTLELSCYAPHVQPIPRSKLLLLPPMLAMLRCV